MIHKFQMFNKNIVLDVESGGVFIFDDLTYKILDFVSIPMSRECDEIILNKFKNYNLNDVKECYNQIYELYSNKILFSEPVNYDKIRSLIKNDILKAICLHVSHDCNLRCKYCFASTGNFGGRRMLMDLSTAKAAINFLLTKSGNRRNLEVDFFGGEPLMNFDVVKQTISYARSLEKKFNKNFRFTITTNATLLDSSIIDYINSEMSNVVLSLDGRKSVNDEIRKMVNLNLSCYDEALPKIKELVDKRRKGEKTNYYIRGTFTNKNLDFATDFIHFYNCGFDQISIEPVVSSDKNEFSLNMNHLPKIFEQYEKIASDLIKLKESKSKINFFHFMIDLKQGPCLLKRLKGCGCGCEYMAVAPDGNIFPCHQFVGDDSFKMGDVFSGEIDDRLKKRFNRANLLNKKKCSSCWAKFYCSGGCNANNFNYEGSEFWPHNLSCQMQRKRIECAIAIKAVLA